MSYLFEEHMRAVTSLEVWSKQAKIAHCAEQGMHVSIVRREHLREFHITLEPLPGESVVAMVRRLQAFISAHEAKVVREEVFGSKKSAAGFLLATAAAFQTVDWPITWVEGAACEQSALAGVHLLAIARSDVEAIFDHGPVGTIFSDGHARYCLLGGIVPVDWNGTRADQARQVYQRINDNLETAGMEITHLARTWLFLDHIDDWYKEFNHARREMFELFDLFSHCVPASTGIGAPSLAGTALVAGAWAVQPVDSRVQIHAVESPLQCSARDYGSCFSRAVEIATPDLRRLLISGTASISPDGSSKHSGNIRRQIALTMDVVREILRSQNMDWKNATRATAYLKNASDAWAWAEYEIEHDLRLPVLVTEADICRPELLFELELDAMVPNPTVGLL